MRRLIFLSALFTFLFLFFLLVPQKDPDIGWHLRCGQDIYNHNLSACKINSYSYSLPNYKINYVTLIYDFLLYITYKYSGYLGLVFVFSLVASLFYTISFSLIKEKHYEIKILLLVVFLSFTLQTFSAGLRPQIVSLLFFVLTLKIFELKKFKFKLITLLPLALIWTNTHQGSFLLPLVCLLFTLDIFIKTKKLNKEYLILTLCTLLGTTLTFKNFFGVYKDIYFHSLSPVLHQIAEWQKPEFITICLLILVFCLTLVTIFYKQKPKHILLPIFFFTFALIAKRNIPYFLIIVFYLVNFEKFNLASFFSKKHLKFISIFYTILALASINKTPKIPLDTNPMTLCTVSAGKMPCEDLEYFSDKKGNVFSLYNWGGLMIWYSPNVKPFIDGRMHVWQDSQKKSIFNEWQSIVNINDGWTDKLDYYKTDYIFIDKNAPLAKELLAGKGRYNWNLEKETSNSVIFGKK